MKITIYDIESGKISRCIECPEDMIEAQIEIGEDFLIGHYSGDNYIAAGAVVAMPPKPGPHCRFNYATKTWFDPRSLSEVRAAAWARIKLARSAAEFGTFTYNGMTFDGDVDAQRRLAGYISVSKSKLAAQQPYSAIFKLANNDLVMLTAEDFVNIEIAKVEQIAQAFAHAELLRSQIDAATTQEQLEAIQWTV